MSGQHVGYKRVSTEDQNTDRQLDGIVLDEVFVDKVSGKDLNRPGLADAFKHCRKGDTLHVHSMDRLSRSLQDLLNAVNQLNAKGVVVRFEKEKLEFTGDDTSASKLMLQIMGAVAEFERSMIRERQREGIAKAKADGKYKGRKPSLDDAKFEELKTRLPLERNRTKLAKELGISRATLYDYIKKAEAEANTCQPKMYGGSAEIVCEYRKRGLNLTELSEAMPYKGISRKMICRTIGLNMKDMDDRELLVRPETEALRHEYTNKLNAWLDSDEARADAAEDWT